MLRSILHCGEEEMRLILIKQAEMRPNLKKNGGTFCRASREESSKEWTS